jgi:16S rRNA (adenine1518-N6/adenine1519-N6)-dimethyltransferase
MKTDHTGISSLMSRHGIRLSKSLGQNFLCDNNVVHKVIDSADISKDDLVIEIGPGGGSLTELLAQKAGRLAAVEIDKRLMPLLEERLSPYDNITLINNDILKIDISKDILSLFPGYRSYKVVGNLPYYITTPIMMKFLEYSIKPEIMVIMMQKEVADRICAGPGSKDYGSLTIAVNFYSSPERIMNVNPGCFIPKPDVTSTVLRLRKRDQPLAEVKSMDMFFKIVRAAFSQRRKKAANSISNTLGADVPRDKIEEFLTGMGKVSDIRAEQLSIKEFALLSDMIYKYVNR